MTQSGTKRSIRLALSLAAINLVVGIARLGWFGGTPRNSWFNWLQVVVWLVIARIAWLRRNTPPPEAIQKLDIR